MDVLDVPCEQCVEDRVEEHDQDDALQAELVAFDGRARDVVPLNTHALHLVKREVLRSQSERGRREERLRVQNNVKASLFRVRC